MPGIVLNYWSVEQMMPNSWVVRSWFLELCYICHTIITEDRPDLVSKVLKLKNLWLLLFIFVMSPILWTDDRNISVILSINFGFSQAFHSLTSPLSCTYLSIYWENTKKMMDYSSAIIPFVTMLSFLAYSWVCHCLSRCLTRCNFNYRCWSWTWSLLYICVCSSVATRDR